MSEFHFIHPVWFLALVPLGLLFWAAWRHDPASSAWRRVIDARLFAVLRVGGDGRSGRLPLLMLSAGWLLAVIALANPTFERKPVPAFRTEAARVVVLDLSRSMLADDLTPTRLERARYKVSDILSRSADGQVGLVVFAGDAFAVSPLTDDADTIRGMLEALSPQIMPLQGSRPDLGIERGLDLLRQAGARNGEVVLLTDDDGGARARAAAEQLSDAGHRLAVIGVGTDEGAPVPGVSRADGPVLSRVDLVALERLAQAGSGAFSALTSGATDLERVLVDPAGFSHTLAARDPLLAERWHELGPWLVLLLLPLAALAFRRGWLLAIVLVVGPGSAFFPQPVMAFGWEDLWQRPDQQAAAAFADGDLARARDLAETPARAGSAAYRLGDFEDAIERFGVGDHAVDHYNRGNALARSGRLEDAIAAYDAALERDPDFEDAGYNRAQVEAALEQMEAERQPDQQQQQQQQQGQDPEQQPDSQEQPDQQSGGQSGPDEQQQDSAQADSSEQQQSGSDSSEQSQTSQASGGDADQSDGDQTAGQQPQPAQASDTAESGQDQAAGDDASASELAAASDPDASAQAAADYRAEAAEAAEAQAGTAAEATDEDGTEAGLQREAALTAEDREARQAADQWLRRIPDDPAELLRRKFLYQYQARQSDANALPAGQPW